MSLLAVIITASQLWFGIKKDERDRAEGIEERPFSDRRDEPPIEQFGAWFTVQKLGVTVDPASGEIDQRTFLTP